MGSSQTKEARPSSGQASRAEHGRQHGQQAEGSASSAQSRPERSTVVIHTGRRRSHRGDLSLVGVADGAAQEQRRETKQEREARRAERERVARAKERERSIREEGIDGGFLVTLGTYTGPEDFSKPIVRHLMIERRLAPFWKGLNEHSNSWTEHQLVAAARGLPIPAPDEIPEEENLNHSDVTSAATLSAPIPVRSIFTQTGSANADSHLSSLTGVGDTEVSQSPPPSQTSPFFRGRYKNQASLSPGTEVMGEVRPPEIHLPKNPYFNGQPVEAYLYKDVTDCPICFLSYPPYLNTTRCCEQPICSECFVQIKRPDPHPPEHTDPNVPPPQDPESKQEEEELISEPATCPFCVTPDFGVTYVPPPFRRGLAYASHIKAENTQRQRSSTNSSTSASQSPGDGNATPANRRRGQSILATDPGVITTDKVRPDWSKKLADARSHRARRSAAATALHTAAYMMGGGGDGMGRFGLGRRRRFLNSDTPGGSSGGGTPREREGTPIPNMDALLATLENQNSSARTLRRDQHARNGSRAGSVTDDIEEMMMMEAIRQSLAAEEERKRKAEKDAAKEAKKEEKRKAKEDKRAAKADRKKMSSSGSSNPQFYSAQSESSQAIDSVPDNSKGKERVVNQRENIGISTVGFDPFNEPTSTINRTPSPSRNSKQGSEQTRKDSTTDSVDQGKSLKPLFQNPRRFRGVSDASSSGSSILESGNNSFRGTSSDSPFRNSPNTSGQNLSLGAYPSESTGSNMIHEGPFNFASLAAVVDDGTVPNPSGRTESQQQVSSCEAEQRNSSSSSTVPKNITKTNDQASGSADTAGSLASHWSTTKAVDSSGDDQFERYGRQTYGDVSILDNLNSQHQQTT